MADDVIRALRDLCNGHANTDRIAYLLDIPLENCHKYLTLLKADSKVKLYDNQWHLNDNKHINFNNSIPDQVLECLSAGRDKRTAVEIQCILPNVRKADLESSLNFLETTGKIKKVVCYQVINPKPMQTKPEPAPPPKDHNAAKQYPIKKNQFDGGKFACEDIRYKDNKDTVDPWKGVPTSNANDLTKITPKNPPDGFPKMPTGNMPAFPPSIDANGQASFIPQNQRQNISQPRPPQHQPRPSPPQKHPNNNSSNISHQPRNRYPSQTPQRMPNNQQRVPNNQQRMPRPHLHNDPFSNTPPVSAMVRLPSQDSASPPIMRPSGPSPPGSMHSTGPPMRPMGPGSIKPGIDPFTNMAYGNTFDGWVPGGGAKPPQSNLHKEPPRNEPPSTRHIPPGGRPDERPILDSRGGKKEDYNRPKRGGRKARGGSRGGSRTASVSSDHTEHLVDPSRQTNGAAVTESSPEHVPVQGPPSVQQMPSAAEKMTSPVQNMSGTVQTLSSPVQHNMPSSVQNTGPSSVPQNLMPSPPTKEQVPFLDHQQHSNPSQPHHLQQSPSHPSQPHILKRPLDQSPRTITQNLINSSHVFQQEAPQLSRNHIQELQNISLEAELNSSVEGQQIAEILQNMPVHQNSQPQQSPAGVSLQDQIYQAQVATILRSPNTDAQIQAILRLQSQQQQHHPSQQSQQQAQYPQYQQKAQHEILPMAIMDSLGGSSDSSDMDEIAPVHILMTHVSNNTPPQPNSASPEPEKEKTEMVKTQNVKFKKSERDVNSKVYEIMRGLENLCKDKGRSQPVLLTLHYPNNPIVPWKAEVSIGKHLNGVGQAVDKAEAVNLAVIEIRENMNRSIKCSKPFIQQTDPFACFLHLFCYKKNYKLPRYNCVSNTGKWSVTTNIRGSNTLYSTKECLDDALKDVFSKGCNFLHVPIPGFNHWDQVYCDYKQVLTAHCPHAEYARGGKVEGLYHSTVAIDESTFSSMKPAKQRWVAEQSAACVACLELELPAFYWEDLD